MAVNDIINLASMFEWSNFLPPNNYLENVIL